jgi:hypothetical protein
MTPPGGIQLHDMRSSITSQGFRSQRGAAGGGDPHLDLSKFPDRPLQFIQIDDKGKCIINHQAFDLIAKINTKVRIAIILSRFIGSCDMRGRPL